LGLALARKLQELTAGRTVNVVVSPAMGGIIIGHEVGRALQVRAIFTERDTSSRAMVLRRGFEAGPADQAVVIEDVVTTGGSTKEVISSLREAGATVIAVGSIIDRSGGRADVGLPRVSLETLHPETYEPDSCPLCQADIPLVKPGSRPG
jgi:orotate phosphoribosyltransferase